MKRLEVIHLRLAGPRPETLIEEMRDSVLQSDPNMIIRLYQHATVETDLAVHIHQADPPPDPDTAELGVRLAAALRKYGMVEHTVWMEQIGTHCPLK